MSEQEPLISFGPRVRKSPYFDATMRHGAKAFTVYNHMYMPTVYTDPITEYWSLVKDVTLWDVACERQVQIAGPGAFKLVQKLTPRDMSTCEVGKCLYLPLTNEAGGIINDAVLLHVAEDCFWLSPGDGDVLLWAMGAAANSELDVEVTEPDVSPLQLQGPKSPLVARDLFGDWAAELKYFRLQETSLDGIPLVLARTGWSGELGYELYLQDGKRGDELWERVMTAGGPYDIQPTAPSTIRSIEGALLSYASDITLADNPFTHGLDRFVDLEQSADFIGKAALQKIKEDGVRRRFVGVEISGQPLAGSNTEFLDISVSGEKVGHITRYVFSPRLGKNIGFANVPVEYDSPGTELTVTTPDGQREAMVCESPWFPPQIRIPAEMKAPA